MANPVWSNMSGSQRAPLTSSHLLHPSLASSRSVFDLYSFCKRWSPSQWLKPTRIYYLTVLLVRIPKSVTLVESQGISRNVFSQEALGENLFSCLFQLPEATVFLGSQTASSVFKASDVWLTPHAATSLAISLLAPSSTSDNTGSIGIIHDNVISGPADKQLTSPLPGTLAYSWLLRISMWESLGGQLSVYHKEFIMKFALGEAGSIRSIPFEVLGFWYV